MYCFCFSLKEYADDYAVVCHILAQKDYDAVPTLFCLCSLLLNFTSYLTVCSRTQEVPKTRRLAFLTTWSRRDPDPGKSRLNAYTLMDRKKIRLQLYLVMISDIIKSVFSFFFLLCNPACFLDFSIFFSTNQYHLQSLLDQTFFFFF